MKYPCFNTPLLAIISFTYLYHLFDPQILLVSAEHDDYDASNEIISIPDGGRRFMIGQLYDARAEQTIDALLWPRDLIEAQTYEDNAYFTKASVTTEDSIKARADLLGINIKVSLISVAFPSASMELSGSFDYLKDTASTSQSTRVAASYRSRTVRKLLNAFDNTLLSPDNMNQQVFRMAEENGPTHFVSSITYGANVVVSFESSYQSEKEQERIALALNGKLDMPDAGIAAEVSGAFESNSTEEELMSNTKVSVFGDVRMTENLPTTVDDAIAFIADLPAKTNTLLGEGIGVPMDVILTPLSWIDSTAAKLMRQISDELLQKLVVIYDSFEKSDAVIRDAMATPYGGYISWKRSLDNFYIRFRNYRADFSTILADALKVFNQGSIGIEFLTTLQMSYIRVSNPFSATAVETRMQKETETLANLMALADDFSTHGILFAESLREYMAPTFDTRFERVYALILVGMEPQLDRESVKAIREFQQLAEANYVPREAFGVNHCKFITDKQSQRYCEETQKFVAIHFDSFCSDFCRHSFCLRQEDEEHLPLCPTVVTGTPPLCDYDADDALYRECSINLEAGECGESAYHDIDNADNPFGDCWCSCPRTQIVEFVRNRAPRRLTDGLPKVPLRPEILSITTAPTEPAPLDQYIRIQLAPDASQPSSLAINYHISYEELMVTTDDKGVKYVTTFEEEVTKDKKVSIVVRGLTAGVTYTFRVSGINKVGKGGPAISQKITVGHRMPLDMDNICVQPLNPLDSSCSQPKLRDNRSIPSWLDTQIIFGISTPPTTPLRRITMHSNLDSTFEIGNVLGNITFDSTLLEECNFLVKGSFIIDTPGKERARCTMELKEAYSNLFSPLGLKISQHRLQATTDEERQKMPVYFAMWDEFDELLATGTWTLLLPSEVHCRDYGLNNLYCRTDTDDKCVSKCDICDPTYIPFGSNCTDLPCPSTSQLFCPIPYDFRPQNYKNEKDEDELESCILRGRNDDTSCKASCHKEAIAVEPTYMPNPLCLSPCRLKLTGNLQTDFNVQRGENMTIGCADGYFVDSGQPFYFVCPSADMLSQDSDDGRIFLYDSQRLRQLEADGTGITNFKTASLSCSKCGPGQSYDPLLSECRFKAHGATSANYVNDGSFRDQDFTTNFDVTGSVAMSSSLSIDLQGGSVLMNSGGTVTQIIRSFDAAAGDVSATDLVPAPGSVWAASVYFKVSDSLKSRPKFVAVGSLSLGGSAETTKQSLVVPAGTTTDWIRTDVRHTFQSSDIRVAVSVTSTIQNLYIDRLEVVLLENMIEHSITTNDVTRGLRASMSFSTSGSGSLKNAVDTKTNQFSVLQQNHLAFVREAERKDTSHDFTILVLQIQDILIQREITRNDINLYTLNAAVERFKFIQRIFCSTWWWSGTSFCRYRVY